MAPVSAAALALAFVAQFGLAGFAFAMYSDGTTKGASYSYVQPDDRTFSVWSMIYALHATVVGYELFYGYNVDGMEHARVWLVVNYIFSGAWLVANGAASHGFSYWLAVVILFVTFYSLYNVHTLLNVDYTRSDVSFFTKATLFGAVSANLCWVTLAAVLNFANTLYDPSSQSTTQIGSADFAIAVVGFVTLLTVVLAVVRMDLYFAGVCIWALLGIHRNQSSQGSSPLPISTELDTMAISGCVAVTLAAILGAHYVPAKVTVGAAVGTCADHRDGALTAVRKINNASGFEVGYGDKTKVHFRLLSIIAGRSTMEPEYEATHRALMNSSLATLDIAFIIGTCEAASAYEGDQDQRILMAQVGYNEYYENFSNPLLFGIHVPSNEYSFDAIRQVSFATPGAKIAVAGRDRSNYYNTTCAGAASYAASPDIGLEVAYYNMYNPQEDSNSNGLPDGEDAAFAQTLAQEICDSEATVYFLCVSADIEANAMFDYWEKNECEPSAVWMTTTTQAWGLNRLQGRSKYLLGAGQWHRQFPYDDEFFTDGADLQAFNAAAFNYTPSYDTVASYTIPYVFMQHLKRAFADFDSPDVREVMRSEYERLRRSLESLVVETIYGRVAFNDLKRNVGRDAAGVQGDTFSSDGQACKVCPALSTPAEARDVCISVSDGTLDSWVRGLGYTLVAINWLLAAAFATWVFRHRKEPVVQLSQPFFLYLVAIGCAISTSTILPLAVDAEANEDDSRASAACLIAPWLYCIGWTLSFSSLFAKSWRLGKIVNNKRMKRLRITNLDLSISIAAVLCVDILILSVWTAVDPLHWARGEAVSVTIQNTPGVVLEVSSGMCSSDYPGGFVAALAVVHVSILIGGHVMLYKVRNVSAQFLERRYLLIILYTSLQLLVLGIPLLFAVGSDPLARFLCLSGIIFLTDLAVLGLIFIPKIRSQARHKGKSADEMADSIRKSSHNSTSDGVRSSAALEDQLERARAVNEELEAECKRLRSQLASSHVQPANGDSLEKEHALTQV
ncbi:Metabotropic glutamate receptor-like protein E [Hondaea fermentalgiana]|uniref:Metabotropic glutamate receptor-like protein E n=1 Tax=Hondaea fermentalgiana TaxID=2315210 RepID=A0A2R5H1G1_9STRA|nr:Metabotropic glutamate receptor-like protein E [Hondaea fermentalgiana]|eukprot:GBG34913.1 Metabotropic glutamate receptor-like protein E [Hondaea fermentalgiana]